MTKENIEQDFLKNFNRKPSLIVKAPGRINLIGEHTDYNDGFVLPAAINKNIYFALSERTDQQINFIACDLNKSFTFSTKNIKKNERKWVNYLMGVIAETFGEKKPPFGFDLAFGGDVPLGAGLSSSAAVESGLVFGLNQLFNLNLSRKDMALIAQRAEHNFAGVKCGIMDMFASLHGKENSVLKLDCRNLNFEYFPFETTKYTLILCNSGVKHSLADSAYNERRIECETGLKAIQQHFPTTNSLRDATLSMLETVQKSLSEVVYRRCKYVIEEIERVSHACEALQKNDFEKVGELMYMTHDGLKNLYEVSCEELDFMVDEAKSLPYVAGARLMGGGFGGCTLNLVETMMKDEFIKKISATYQKKYSLNFNSYEVSLTNGVELVS